MHKENLDNYRQMFRSYQPHSIQNINDDKANEADNEQPMKSTNSEAAKKESEVKVSKKLKKTQTYSKMNLQLTKKVFKED